MHAEQVTTFQGTRSSSLRSAAREVSGSRGCEPLRAVGRKKLESTSHGLVIDGLLKACILGWFQAKGRLHPVNIPMVEPTRGDQNQSQKWMKNCGSKVHFEGVVCFLSFPT